MLLSGKMSFYTPLKINNKRRTKDTYCLDFSNIAQELFSYIKCMLQTTESMIPNYRNIWEKECLPKGNKVV